MKVFWARTFSTVVLLSLFCLAIFWKDGGRYIFGLLTVLLSYFTVHEAGGMLKTANLPVHTKTVGVFCALNAAAVLSRGLFGAWITAALFGLTEWYLLLKSCNQREKMIQVCMSCGLYFLFAVPISLMISVYRIRECGAMMFFFLILCTKIGDIGAYVFGTLSNVILKGKNHKVIPSVSPGKSYEGCAGGLICTAALCWILWPYCGFQGYSRYLSLILGVVMYFGGAIGDLAESSLKRTCGVKDSGHTLPGIGGIFDLVDSLMMNSMVFFLFRVLLKYWN